MKLIIGTRTEQGWTMLAAGRETPVAYTQDRTDAEALVAMSERPARDAAAEEALLTSRDEALRARDLARDELAIAQARLAELEAQVGSGARLGTGGSGGGGTTPVEG